MTTVAENFNRLRMERGLSLYKIAEATGIPCSTLLRIERGEHKRPQLTTVYALADFFKVPVNAIDETRRPGEAPSAETRRLNSKIPLIPAEQLVKLLTDHDLSYVKDMLPALPYHNLGSTELVAIQATGPANEPDIRDGDILYIKPMREAIPAAGGYVIALDLEENIVIRKYVGGDAGQRWLEATNKTFAGSHFAACKYILGYVIAITRRL